MANEAQVPELSKEIVEYGRLWSFSDTIAFHNPCSNIVVIASTVRPSDGFWMAVGYEKERFSRDFRELVGGKGGDARVDELLKALVDATIHLIMMLSAWGPRKEGEQ